MATTKVAVGPMKVAQIPKAGADFEIVERMMSGDARFRVVLTM